MDLLSFGIRYLLACPAVTASHAASVGSIHWIQLSVRVSSVSSLMTRMVTDSLPPPGRWTEDEDALLTTAVEAYGTHWFQVEKMLPRRTDDQCAKRWRENLDPSISRKPWTEEDDKLLMETYEKIGKRWKEIASHFEGRPPVHCRNRLQSLIRVRCRAAAGKAVQAKVKGRKSITRKKVTPTESTLAPLDFSGGVRIRILSPLPTFVDVIGAGNSLFARTRFRIV